MTDRLSPAERRRHMQRIRGKDTRPEKQLRQLLHAAGFRYRLHARNLPGRPDLVLPRYKAVIFVHGCFWHRHAGCMLGYSPKSRIEFWTRKFEGNVVRDRRQRRTLKNTGWRVAVVWECSLRKLHEREAAAATLSDWLRTDSAQVEIPRCPIRRRPPPPKH